MADSSVDPGKKDIDTWAAVHRWKAFRERRKHVYRQISVSRAKRRKQSELTQQERAAQRHVPLELLAREWLNEQRAGLNTRAYLTENLLPTLVLGVEKLLTEVSLRGIAEREEEQPDFNPVNYLAQYLMRNNPRYSNFAEAHPYCRTMHEVTEKLKRMAFSVDENKLAGVKVQMRQRRKERERREAVQTQEEGRREGVLGEVFARWSAEGREEVSLGQVKHAVRSWLKTLGDPTLAEGSLSTLLQEVEKNVTQQECVDVVMRCALELSVDLFESLSEYLGVCGRECQRIRAKEERREFLNRVFGDCDPGNTGSVDRPHILRLFASYYDSASPDTQRQLRNPRLWPVAEVVDAGEGEEGKEAGGSVSEQDYLEFIAEEGANRSDGEKDVGKAEPQESDRPAVEDRAEKTSEAAGKQPTHVAEEEEGSPPSKPLEESAKELEEEGTLKQGDSEGATPPPTDSTLNTCSQAMSICRARKLSGELTLGEESTLSRLVTPSGPGSSWDHCLLNLSQFVQLVELFLGEDPGSDLVQSLSAFLQENFQETEQERAERSLQARLQAVAVVRHQRMNSLFDVWDSDHSGYLELEELQPVLDNWKGFDGGRTQEQGKEMQKRLTRRQFHSCMNQLTAGMESSEFGEFIDYLTTSVKLTVDEVCRGKKRKEFLSQITLAGQSSGLQFAEALKTAVSVIQQDGAEFGGGKECCVSLALLETSPVCLKYQVSSDSCEAYVVGQKLHRSHKQVSFQAVDSGRPVHVPNIQKHGRVFFFCPEHKTEEFNGSLVVVPLTSPQQRVVGTCGVDTLTDRDSAETSFSSHEISFYQGVGVCLGDVLHWVDCRHKLLQVAQSALAWVHRHCSQVGGAEVYLVEPEAEDGFTLRVMLEASQEECRGGDQQTPERLRRKDNLFKEYLFHCVDNSEPVSADVYGHHHLAYPLRDHTGCAVAVVDLRMPPSHSVQPQQAREVTRALKLLTKACYQISHEPDWQEEEGGVSPHLLVPGGGDQAVMMLFDQLLLSDLRECVARLDKRVFAELRSCVDPPDAILQVIQAVLLILCPDQECKTWAHCKQHITLGLVKALELYNPLVQKPHPKLGLIKQLLEGVPPGSVHKYGSLPAAVLHSWVSVCLSLLELSTGTPDTGSQNTSSTTSGTSS